MKRLLRASIWAAVMGALASCGSLDFDAVSSRSQLDGRLFVMWVGEGSPSSGDGQFVFVPNPTRPAEADPQRRLRRADGGGDPARDHVYRWRLDPAPSYCFQWLFALGIRTCLYDP